MQRRVISTVEHHQSARCRYLQWCAGLERVFNMLMGPGGPGFAGPETPISQVSSCDFTQSWSQQ